MSFGQLLYTTFKITEKIYCQQTDRLQAFHHLLDIFLIWAKRPDIEAYNVIFAQPISDLRTAEFAVLSEFGKMCTFL